MATRSSHRRVEPLQMSGLHDTSMHTSKLEDGVGIGEAGGQRLFDQQVNTRRQERSSGGSMMHRRHADRRCVQIAHRRQTRLDAVEASNVKLCRGVGRDSRVAIDYCDQPDVLTGLLKLAIDTKVVAPEGPRSDDCNTQWMRCSHYFDATGASTAWRQRE